jgi:SAM-dependent methyltransferase
MLNFELPTSNPLPSLNTLHADLTLVQNLVDISSLLRQKVAKQNIKQYYRLTNFLYRRFHSHEGAMHFPLYLPNQAQNHFEGLTAQAQFVAAQCAEIQAHNVLEIGSGQGYNTLWLAKQNADSHFTGLDLMPFQARQAQHKARKSALSNAQFIAGDFAKPPFSADSFELVFAVESFCYARRLAEVLTEVARILRKGGRLVIFDVFLHEGFENLPFEVQTATQLTGIGFAVARWYAWAELIAAAEQVGLFLLDSQNLSSAVRPNLLRFQTDMRRWLMNPWFRRLVRLHLIPKAILWHGITGLLAAHTVGDEAQGYFQIVFEKL